MKYIKITASMGMQEQSEFLEFNDNATINEIEEAAKDIAFNYISWGYAEITEEEFINREY